MTIAPLSILLIGGTGSIGRHVARRALADGHAVRVLTRRPGSAPAGTEVVTGDLADPAALATAVEGIDAVVLTHGAPYQSPRVRDVDYGGVRSLLEALGGREVRIALMTAIGVTLRGGEYHDWKRRSERLVRASGLPYTIVRPGWFDANRDDQHELVLLQGDRRRTGTPADGVIARAQIADVLVSALTSDAARGRTFELVAERGPAQADLEPRFAALAQDRELDGALDEDNLPLAAEPADVRADLERAAARRTR